MGVGWLWGKTGEIVKEVREELWKEDKMKFKNQLKFRNGQITIDAQRYHHFNASIYSIKYQKGVQTPSGNWFSRIGVFVI